MVCVAAGCYSPSPVAGLPCSDGEPRCPSGQTCDVAAPGGPTCLAPGQSDAPPGTPDADDDPPDASVDAGGGGLVNDHPAGAIDVGDGGDFVFDTADGVTDDVPTPCSGNGLDVFYTIVIPDDEVVYVDTFGTDFDAVLMIYEGDCTPLGAQIACEDDPCDDGQAQGAWNLTAGRHCIIVDQGGAGQTGTHGELHVRRTGHAGIPFPDTAGTVDGDTCDADDDSTAPCGCTPQPDIHYFFTLCPEVQSKIDAFVCDASDYDAVMEIRDIDDNTIDCNDDSTCGDSSVGGNVVGPGLWWVIMDGCGGCGTYTMTYSY
jgi:hypothetical protein